MREKSFGAVLGKIFISHSSVNNAEALAIHDWLVEQGWGDIFLDLDPKRGLVAGDRWQAALKSAAEQCELILILISPDWAKSRWCLAEFLLAKQMNKQILGVLVQPTPIEDLPVELTAEWQLVDLSAPDTGWSATISPPRFEPETTVSFSGTGLARLRSGLEKAGLDATTFNWPPAHDLGRSPYRGLLPLDQDDAGIFFGRDGAIVLTLDALRGLRASAAPRFATILGASGAGKSSFLRAGILPRLNRDSRHFYVLPIIRPERAALTGEHGFAAMIEAAFKARNITRNRADIRDAVKAGAEAVAPLLRELAISADAGDVGSAEPPTLVIAVDQAEELLTADNAEAGAFLALLAELGRRDDPAVMVLLTVRSDSYDQLQSRPELAATQPHHLIDLPPVPAGSFGDIIRGPARRVTAAGRKLRVDETLVDALLADIEVGGTKDALPLLAFTLERLYTDYGADGDLQLAEYERLGRIRGAIEAAVEQALTKADGNNAIPKDRAARLALLRRGLIPWLAGIDPSTGSPRRRVARLAEVPDEARPLIELMVEQRLLATDFDSATKERTIEPAHEALLRQWGALDGWLAEDSADLATIEALRRAATEWEANARASEFVAHRGARLQAIEQVASAEKFASYLTSVDRAYLSAARNLENGAIRKARAARTRLAIAASVVGVVLVAGGTAGYFIWSAGEAAKTQAQANFLVARSEAALRSGRSEEAAQFALNALELWPSSTTRTSALAASMSISPHARGTVNFESRMGAVQWTASSVVEVLTPGKRVTAIDIERRNAAAQFDVPAAVGQFVVTGGEVGFAHLPDDTYALFYVDGSIRTGDGREIAPAARNMLATQVAASDDGGIVMFASPVAPPLLQDCRTIPCKSGYLAGAESSSAVAVKPDGSAVAFANEAAELIVVRPDRDAPLQIKLADPAKGLDWGGGDTIAVAMTSGVHVYRLDEPDLVGSFVAIGDTSVVAVSASDATVAAPCHRTNICIYRAQPPMPNGYVAYEQTAEFFGHQDAITRLEWSPDGTVLASSSADRTVRFWSLTADRNIAFDRTTVPVDVSLTSLAVDRNRGIIAAGGGNSVWIWSGDEPTRTLRGSDIEGKVTSIAFLSDGRLAVVYENVALAVWTIGNDAPDHVTRLDNLSFSRVAALTGDVRAAVPLSDKTVLVLSGDELSESRVPADSIALDQWGMVGAPVPNTVFASYSDGSIRRRDLLAGGDGTTVFDAGNPICGALPTTDNNGSKSLDVSVDGKWLVATRSDSAVIVHNLQNPAQPICVALPAPDSKTVAFSPDSTKLAILSATDELYLFDLNRPTDALLLGVPAVPPNSVAAKQAEVRNESRTTSWLAWDDDDTLLVSTIAGAVEVISLDPASWQARVDSLFFTQ